MANHGSAKDGALWVAWPEELAQVPADSAAPQVPATFTTPAAASAAVRQAGAIPWRIVRLRTPQPIQQNLATLQTELEALARLARDAGAGRGLRARLGTFGWHL